MSSPEYLGAQNPESIVAASLAMQICAHLPPDAKLPHKITFLTGNARKASMYKGMGFDSTENVGADEAKMWRDGNVGSGDDHVQGMRSFHETPGFYGMDGNQYPDLSAALVRSPATEAVWRKIGRGPFSKRNAVGANDVTAIIMRDTLGGTRHLYASNTEYPWCTRAEGDPLLIDVGRYKNLPRDREAWVRTLFNNPEGSWQLTVHNHTGFQFGPSIDDYFGLSFLVSFSRKEEFYTLCRERLKDPNPKIPVGFDLANPAFAPFVEGVFARSFGHTWKCNNVPLYLPNAAHGVPDSTYLQLAHGPCPLVLSTIKQIQRMGGLNTYAGEGI